MAKQLPKAGLSLTLQNFNKFSKDIKSLDKNVRALNRGLLTLNQQLSQLSQHRGLPPILTGGSTRTSSTINSISSGLKKATTGFRDFGRVGVNVLENLGRGFTFVLSETLELSKTTLDLSRSFESAFTGMTKTVDGLVEVENGMLKLTEAGIRTKNILMDLSTEIPLSFEEIAKIGEIGGQLGIFNDLAAISLEEADAEVRGFIETIAGLVSATDLSIDQATLQLSQITNIFKEDFPEGIETSTQNVRMLAEVIVLLGNKMATTEKFIVQTMARIAGAGAVVGATQRDLLAISAATAAMGVEPQAAGSSVSRVLLDMQNVFNSGAEAQEDFIQQTYDNSKAMEKLEDQILIADKRLKDLEKPDIVTNEKEIAKLDSRIEKVNEKIRKAAADLVQAEAVAGVGRGEELYKKYGFLDPESIGRKLGDRSYERAYNAYVNLIKANRELTELQSQQAAGVQVVSSENHRSGQELLALKSQYDELGYSMEDFNSQLTKEEAQIFVNTKKINGYKAELAELQAQHGKLIPEEKRISESDKWLKVIQLSEEGKKHTKESIAALFDTGKAGDAFLLLIKGLSEAEEKGAGFLKELELNTIQIRRTMLNLAASPGVLQEAMRLANEESATSAELINEVMKRYATLDSQLKMLTNRFRNFGATIGDYLNPILAKAIRAINPYLDIFDEKFPLILGGLTDIIDEVIDYTDAGIGIDFDFLSIEKFTELLDNAIYTLNNFDPRPLISFVNTTLADLNTGLLFLYDNIELISGTFLFTGAALLVAGGITLLATAITTLLSPIGLVTAGVVALGAAWTTNFLGIREITYSTLEVLKTFSVSFVGGIIQTEGPLVRALNNVGDSFSRFFDILVRIGAIDFTFASGGAIIDVLTRLTPILGDFVGTMLSINFTYMSNAIDVLSSFINLFATGGSIESFRTFGESLRSFVIEPYAELYGFLDRTFDLGFLDVFSDYLVIITDSGKSFLEGFMKPIAPAAAKLWDAIKNLAGSFKDLGSAIADSPSFQLIWGWISDTGIGRAIKENADSIVNFTGGLGEFVGVLVSFPINVIKELIDALAAFIDIISSLGTVLKDGFDLQPLKDFSNELSDLLLILPDFSKDWQVEAPFELGPIFDMPRIEDLPDSGIFGGTLTSGIFEFDQTLAEKISNTASLSGSALIDGIIKSLNEGEPQLTQTIQDFSQSMLDGWKAFWNIESPSMVAQEIGQSIVEGFILGLMGGEEGAGIGDVLVSSFQQAIPLIVEHLSALKNYFLLFNEESFIPFNENLLILSNETFPLLSDTTNIFAEETLQNLIEKLDIADASSYAFSTTMRNNYIPTIITADSTTATLSDTLRNNYVPAVLKSSAVSKIFNEIIKQLISSFTAFNKIIIKTTKSLDEFTSSTKKAKSGAKSLRKEIGELTEAYRSLARAIESARSASSSGGGPASVPGLASGGSFIVPKGVSTGPTGGMLIEVHAGEHVQVTPSKAVNQLFASLASSIKAKSITSPTVSRSQTINYQTDNSRGDTYVLNVPSSPDSNRGVINSFRLLQSL